MIPYIHTVQGVTVVLHGVPYNIDKTHELYPDVIEGLSRHESPAWFEQVLTALQRKVEAATKLTPNMVYSGGVVLYKGDVLSGYAIDKLVAFIEGGYDAEPLAKFLEKLQLNPSNQTVENLYQFLEYGKIPLTKDGNFLAYKAIGQNWKDIHSGTMDNSIGRVVEMPRKSVDDRRDVTCSHGLHVCSFDYLPHFAHANGHVVICEIDPADVVAIPADYNNTKMRVSKYRVVGELEGYYKEHRDVLSEAQVWDPEYTVYGRQEDTDEWSELGDAETGLEAVEKSDFYLNATIETDYGNDELTINEVKVVDSNGVTIHRKHV
jgi:hypothetical protein